MVFSQKDSMSRRSLRGRGTMASRCSLGNSVPPYCLAFMSNGSWTRTRAVDFGTTSPSSLELVIAASVGVHISLHLDTLDGSTVASCTCDATGSFTKYGNCSCPFSAPATGVHDVYLQFESQATSKYLLNFRSWLLVGGRATQATPPATAVSISLGLVNTSTYVGPSADGTRLVTNLQTPYNMSLLDNEDGSWVLQAGAKFVCVTTGRQVVLATTKSACTRLRIQVQDHYSIYSFLSLANSRWLGSIGNVLSASAFNPRNPLEVAQFYVNEATGNYPPC